jgi:putative flippase GtrA
MASMQSSKPTQKVLAGAFAGAITTILVWVLKNFAHTDIPGEIAAAITTVLTFVVSYLVPPSAADQVNI